MVSEPTVGGKPALRRVAANTASEVSEESLETMAVVGYRAA